MKSFSFIPWRNNLSKVKKMDLLFPVLHGPNGEDGKIQGLLEMAQVPFAGANSFSSGLAMNKYISKILFLKAGLNTPKFLYFEENTPSEIIRECEKSLLYPIFIKPCSLGSSIGISKISHKSNLESSLDLAFKYDKAIIIEEAIDCLEVEVSVLGNQNLIISEPGQIIPHNEFYDYEDKYLQGKTEFLIPAPLDNNLVTEIKKITETAFRSHFLNGCSRIDFLIEKNTYKIFINEINTIPGFTDISMFPKLLNHSGITFKKLITRMIQLGFEYFNNNNIEIQADIQTK
jgi:D-alanine-D-alanine ligase